MRAPRVALAAIAATLGVAACTSHASGHQHGPIRVDRGRATVRPVQFPLPAADPGAAFVGRELTGATARGHTVVAVGARRFGQRDEPFFERSTDGGRHFTPATMATKAGYDDAPMAIAAGPSGFAAMGNGPAGPVTWSSPDGKRWRRGTPAKGVFLPDDLTGLEPYVDNTQVALAHVPGGFLAVSRAPRFAAGGSTLISWSSPDGRGWTRHERRLFDDGGDEVPSQLAVSGGTAVLALTRSSGPAVLLRTTDVGRTWTASRPLPGFSDPPLLIGGNGFTAATNDGSAPGRTVYRSKDGATWRRSPAMRWPPHIGRLADLQVGVDDGHYAAAANVGGDILTFSSTEGRIWARTGQVRATTRPRTRVQLYGFAVAGRRAVMVGQIVRVGDDLDTGGLAAVWSDRGQAGLSTLRLAPVRTSAGTLNAVAGDGRALVAVGAAGIRPLSWRSVDGGSWSAADVGQPAGPSDEVSYVTAGPRGWVAADRSSSVWRSSDGSRWTRTALTSSRGSIRGVASGPRADVLTGSDFDIRARATPLYSVGTGFRPGQSRPGHDDLSATSPQDSKIMWTATPTGTGFVAAGTLGQQPYGACAWTSPDGRTWTFVPLPRQSGVSDAQATLVAVDGTRTLLTGVGFTRDHSTRAVGWLSLDGRRWSTTAGPSGTAGEGAAGSGASGTSLTGVTVLDHVFLAYGSVGDQENDDAAIWRSRDGRSWTRVPVPGGRGGGDGYQAITGIAQLHGDPVIVGQDYRAIDGGPYALRVPASRLTG